MKVTISNSNTVKEHTRTEALAQRVSKVEQTRMHDFVIHAKNNFSAQWIHTWQCSIKFYHYASTWMDQNVDHIQEKPVAWKL